MTVTLTWRWNAAARPCPPMATHANPGCGTDCTKHAGTQLHRPNRPEPPRPRHAPAVQAPNPKRPRRAPAPLPGRAGPGAAWEEQGVVHGVYWIQFCIANRQFTRAARRPQRPALPRRGARSEERGARSEERGAGSGERGGPGRSGRCAGCVAGSNSHWQCRFRRPVALPQAPALPRRRLRVLTLRSP